MNKELKTALIIGGVLIAGYIAYNYVKKKAPATTPAPAAGTTNSSSGNPIGNIANDITSASGALSTLGDAFGSP